VKVEKRLERSIAESGAALAKLILTGAAERPGYLIFNTLGFRRMVSVPIDSTGPIPQPAGENSWVQWEGGHHALTVDIPGAGFVWIPADSVPRVSARSAGAAGRS